jgi:NAD(P)-dependent dehydrogenase (short-subunit alcohol dehydrogenase family)
MQEQICYVCKQSIEVAHTFYTELCARCGGENYIKRAQTADLRGYTAVVTGGRLKIGFQIALKLLRAGARVIITTRFADDAQRRFSEENDFDEWAGRIQVFAADFRVIAAVDAFSQWLCRTFSQIDILVNNAAQTVRRPPAFYRHLVQSESSVASSDFPPTGLRNTLPSSGLLTYRNETMPAALAADSVAHLSQLALIPGDDDLDEQLFPKNAFDNAGQQEDRRGLNSWMMRLEDVHLIELLEVMYINAVAPCLLCSRLKNAMRKHSGSPSSFVINVTSMEGNFANEEKTWRHPHTNMAKAALNMLTRTAAIEFLEANIFMTAVDPGYITNEKPFPLTQGSRKTRMALDEIDGAARVCDPVFRALNYQEYLHGVLLKNYAVHPW